MYMQHFWFAGKSGSAPLCFLKYFEIRFGKRLSKVFACKNPILYIVHNRYDGIGSVIRVIISKTLLIYSLASLDNREGRNLYK